MICIAPQKGAFFIKRKKKATIFDSLSITGDGGI